MADYYLQQLGSSDVTVLEIQMPADDQVAQDFGHIDIWTASDAPALVWQPVADWIAAHTERPGGGRRWLSERH
ncbi:MAG: hypothetical protein IH621_06325 [Krumholzibacteria bacterium]|nr:hypothetical protein [Candidatus Krumholzibacteria bacterium]